MTRYGQWKMRRAKYKARMKKWRGNLPRYNGDHAYNSSPDGNTHHRPAGVIFYGKQPLPRISKKLFKATHSPGTPAYFVTVTHTGGSGYADPPHVGLTLPVPLPPGNHTDEAYVNYHSRAITVSSRPRGRLKGVDRRCWHAWLFKKFTGKWPVWDPKGRTPVDPLGTPFEGDWHY